jgi:hypothetical protein
VLNDRRVDGTLETLVVLAVFVLGAGRVRKGSAGRAFAGGQSPGELLLDGLVHSGQEDDLGVCATSHLLHGLEVSVLEVSKLSSTNNQLDQLIGRQRT